MKYDESKVRMEIKVAIGIGSKSATDILKVFSKNFPDSKKLNYSILKKILTEMIDEGGVVCEKIKGHYKYKVRII